MVVADVDGRLVAVVVQQLQGGLSRPSDAARRLSWKCQVPLLVMRTTSPDFFLRVFLSPFLPCCKCCTTNHQFALFPPPSVTFAALLRRRGETLAVFAWCRELQSHSD